MTAYEEYLDLLPTHKDCIGYRICGTASKDGDGIAGYLGAEGRSDQGGWICTLPKDHVYPTHIASDGDNICWEWTNDNAAPEGTDGWW